MSEFGWVEKVYFWGRSFGTLRGRIYLCHWITMAWALRLIVFPRNENFQSFACNTNFRRNSICRLVRVEWMNGWIKLSNKFSFPMSEYDILIMKFVFIEILFQYLFNSNFEVYLYVFGNFLLIHYIMSKFDHLNTLFFYEL